MKRIMNLIRGFFGSFVSDMEKSNPKILLEAETENLQKHIARYNENLANQAAMTDRLMRQIQALEKREIKLAKQTATLLSGQQRELAGKTALELKTVREQLEENRRQLEMAEQNFKQLIQTRDAAIAEARQKIEKIRKLITETEMLEAQAELQQMAAPKNAAMSGPAETLNRLENYLEERRSQATGKIILTTQTASSETNKAEQAAEQLLAEEALQEFEFQYMADQITVSGESNPANKPLRKELGPRETETS